MPGATASGGQYHGNHWGAMEEDEPDGETHVPLYLLFTQASTHLVARSPVWQGTKGSPDDPILSMLKDKAGCMLENGGGAVCLLH